jgi:phytoene desaturase
LFYVGFDKKIENISHHALFLMWILSACKDIYDAPQCQKSLFYANSPLTDKTAAPEGMESGFFLFRWHLELMTRRSKRSTLIK